VAFALSAILEHILQGGRLDRVQHVLPTAIHLPLGQFQLQSVCVLLGMLVMLQHPEHKFNTALSKAAMVWCVQCLLHLHILMAMQRDLLWMDQHSLGGILRVGG
jgi:hypothetical protein